MRAALRPSRRRGRGRASGQALIIFILAFVVLVGFTGLSVDVGHAYVAHRQTQDGTDAAALAGGRQLLTADIVFNTPPAPTKSGGGCCSAPLAAAHDYAQQNGFTTTMNEACESYASGGASPHLDEVWFNPGYAGSCTATSGFSTKVEFHTPPTFSAGEPSPPDCAPSSPFRFNCVQVVITSLIPNYFLSALGFASQYTVTKATAFASPSSNVLGTPPATAIYLYEPQTGCSEAGQQCFNDSSSAPAPSRTQLSCAESNCPTFWTGAGTHPSIFGYDGSKQNPALLDTPTVESNGDMVINDDTTFCDPYNKGSTWCATNPPVPAGAQGYSTPSGSTLFCQPAPGATFPQTAPATPSGCSAAPTGVTPAWAGVKHLKGNGVPFTPCNTTCSITVTPPTADCGALVLNGESVQSHYSPGDACYPAAGDEYTIHPGKYQYIVINHGQYVFDSGAYEITGTAPVFTTTTSAYTASGIDHANEVARDFDLCSTYNIGNTSTQCPNLTAGVWIGHGKGNYTAASTGTTGGTCAGGGGVGSQAGGGDATSVSGSGVTFLLDSTSGGFVVTNEVAYVHLSSPGMNNASSQFPVLVDDENSSFIHLDGQHGSGSTTSQYAGMLYQNPSVKAGGVELDPATGGPAAATLLGQILAYSFTTFGGAGIAVDFSGGYGAAGGLGISSSGHSEPSVIVTNNNAYSPRTVDNGDGTETFSLDYTDEWALDAYDTYIKINSGSPIFFSQNMWTCGALCGGALPPEATNTPSDTHPAYHGATAAGGYSLGPGRGSTNMLQGQEAVAAGDDWIESLTVSGVSYTVETLGQWTWGHEKDLSGTSMGNPDLAEINLTFPKPAGTSFTLSIFMEDGDHCGDYASAQYTFAGGGGQPGGGLTNGGGVSLEE